MAIHEARAPLNEFFESTDLDLTEICNNLRQIDSIKDNRLIMQAIAVGRLIVQVVQARMGTRSDTAVVQELKKFHLAGFGKPKVAESERFYRLRFLYRRLLNVTCGCTTVALTQA